MRRTHILHLAAGFVGRVSELRHQQVSNLAHGFGPVEAQCLFICIGNMSR